MVATTEPLKVPDIDLSLPDSEILGLIREACTTSGFFVIKNHGIPTELADKALSNCKALFSLPEDKKLSLKSDVLFTGYQPYGGIHVDPQKDQQEGDRREGFYACKGAPWVSKTETFSWPDQWPSEDVLPGFADVDKAFCKASMELTYRTAKLLSKVLSEPDTWLESYIQDPFVALHNLHYAPIKSEPEKGILGLGAHSDFGLFTFLLCNEPGLQIQSNDGKWVDIAVDDNSIIVNLGDQLQRCTNDKFKSQIHRVVNFGKDRYSVAFFVNADYESTLECLPSCCNDTPAKYEPIKSSDFMHQKFSSVHKS